jgi:hypothetical protein
MPKHLSSGLTLLLGLLICYSFLAATSPAATKQYEYLTITQSGDELDISSPPDHFEQTRHKLTKNGYNGNFSLLFAKVNEYEAQGYELVENTALSSGASGALLNYVMLRRLKQ